jgi:bacterioferritin-associated ferredoxin
MRCANAKSGRPPARARNARPKCGQCLSFARELIAEEQQSAQA